MKQIRIDEKNLKVIREYKAANSLKTDNEALAALLPVKERRGKKNV